MLLFVGKLWQSLLSDWFCMVRRSLIFWGAEQTGIAYVTLQDLAHSFSHSVWASVLSKISLVGSPASTPPSHPSATPSLRSGTSTASNGVLFTLWQMRHPILFISVFLPPNFKLKWETWGPVHLSDLTPECKLKACQPPCPSGFPFGKREGLVVVFVSLSFICNLVVNQDNFWSATEVILPTTIRW